MNLTKTIIATLVTFVAVLYLAGSARAQEVVGILQPNQTVSHSIQLNNQPYSVHLFFDTGDVDWTLYDATSIVANESGVDNPDIENNVRPPRVGSYRLEVRNLRAVSTSYRVQFRTGDSEVVDTEVTTTNNSMTGRLNTQGSEASADIHLAAGNYTAYCYFDSGDVDWVLFDGQQEIARESGVDNPDMEQVRINRTGTYRLVVRNLMTVATNFRVEFKNDSSVVNPTDAGVVGTYKGTFTSSVVKRVHQISLKAGTYRVVTSFDKGDVDWSLTRNNQAVANEYGVDNPDIEENVNIPQTATYTLEVRRLRDATRYSVQFIKTGIISINNKSSVIGNRFTGILATGGSQAEGSIHLAAGTYTVSCAFDSGDVDWALYDGTEVIANESGIDNPDMEQVQISKNGYYKLVVTNISSNTNKFVVDFKKGISNLIPDKTGGTQVSGQLDNINSTRTHNVYLNAGQYRVTCYFDSGDVDWTLKQGDNSVAYEFGTDNPDVEDNVSIPNTGNYTFEVNNVRNNSTNYRVVFERIGGTTQPQGSINVTGNMVTGVLSSSTNRLEGNIFIAAGTYETVLNFDSGDVDWVLYDGSSIVASESGVSNPDKELIHLDKSKTYRIEVMNISRNTNSFKLEFLRTSTDSNSSSNIRVIGNIIEGDFVSNSISLETPIQLTQGVYDIYCSFDDGDVDWTLNYNNSYLTSESGTSNPDIENNVTINQSGKYTIQVRNLRNNLPNHFKIEFRRTR